MTELPPPSPDQEQLMRIPILLEMLGHTAIYGYDHLPIIRERSLPLFAIMEKEVAHRPQPLHPDITITAENTRRVLASHTIATPERPSFPEKFMSSIYMTQFTDRLVGHERAFFDYASMKALKDCFVTSAKRQSHPLGFDQQLDIAMELADNDITQALTNLWFTSRQYARWLDSVSILNFPELTPEEIIAEMKEWRGSILACKNANEKNFQDTAGDTYYTWTHARARVLYGSEPGIANQIGKLIFQHGTDINTHARFIKQSIPSNHKIAAKYGNRIGDVILDAIR